ncbi:hypothetical protein TNCV_910541 [Trichonephila clavipes]|uniref:Uncharacterized protein n=1 Tax=Trichonephila clavipes TaxID=2585209 RepID=A0A8X7BDN0_TRICX|nr:hypothetical protein TNCV_910541 [Trichonephila clavipes]
MRGHGTSTFYKPTGPKIVMILECINLSSTLLRQETDPLFRIGNYRLFLHLFKPIKDPLESFNYKCPIKKKKQHNSLQSLNDVIHWSPSTINVPAGEKTARAQHINSLKSLNDVIHWSPSTIRELGHPVAPTGGEQVADACLKRLQHVLNLEQACTRY